MRPTFLKPSMVEPNFAFGLGNDGGHLGSSSPDSAEYHSDHSDFVLHKTDKPLHKYRMSSGEVIAQARTPAVDATFRQKLSAHCQVKWALYIILILGFVSISGCIAAGVALAAVQPYLVEDATTTTSPPPLVLFPQRSSSTTQPRKVEQSGVEAGTDMPPDLLRRIFSTIRDAGMQESSLELRNATVAPAVLRPTSTDLAQTNGADLAAPSIREILSTSDFGNRGVATVMPVVQSLYSANSPFPGALRPLPVVHIVDTIPERDKLFLFQQTSRFTAPPPTAIRQRTSQLMYFDDNREPDRFPAALRNSALDPRSQDLNITFEDPYALRPRTPLVLKTRGFAKRAAVVKMMAATVEVAVSPRNKPAPAPNLGQFTMMQPSMKMVEVQPSRKIDIAGEGRPLEPKALVPDIMLSSMCEAGFDWNPVLRECRDVDECLQMGIRACGVHSECTNIPGTYTCRCSPGFRLDPKSLVCTDIDECKESNGECSPLAQCLNLQGGFVCRCMEGFYGNGIVCEIDGSGATDPRATKGSLPCQTSLPPRSHQVVSSPYYPEPFPVHSRYKFCVQKIHGICKTGFVLKNFLPSSSNHQDFDHLTMQGKVLTGSDQNGQSLWLLDSGDGPIDVEFSTDSDLKGNRFTLEITQEQCGGTFSVPECADLLDVQGNSITSAGPHYIDNLACTTALYPPHEACGMELKFHQFSLEGPRETCLYDYLEINEDKMCGNLKNEIREIIFPRNTQKIPIIFSTDSSFVSLGFNITFAWITECYQ